MSLRDALTEIEEFIGLKIYAVAAETEAGIDCYPRNGWIAFKDKSGHGVAVLFDHGGIISVNAANNAAEMFGQVWAASKCPETVHKVS